MTELERREKEEISSTGYWKAETASQHHVYSKELGLWICEFLKGQEEISTYDMGCGMGNYLKELKDAGFLDLIGLEGEPPINKAFDIIFERDLTEPLSSGDWIFEGESGNVISLEVGEHIPKEFMSIYLDNITKFCNGYLITSWAVRGQAGFGHVNCLDNHEIIPEFEKRGFKYLEKETLEARSIIQDYCAWFRNTILIFKKM